MKFAKKIALVVAVVGGVGLLGGVASLRADAQLGRLSGNAADVAARAGEVEHQIKSDYRDVLGMQQLARREKDVIKLNCINDKLIQIKAEMNIADSARQQVNVELSIGAKADRDSWFSQLLASETRIRDLHSDANGCLGKVDLSNDSSSSSSHPDFPDDPSVIPFDIYTEAPAYASPFN